MSINYRVFLIDLVFVLFLGVVLVKQEAPMWVYTIFFATMSRASRAEMLAVLFADSRRRRDEGSSDAL